MKNNQAKVFVAMETGYEHGTLLGVDMTLEAAVKRFKGKEVIAGYGQVVIECPIGSPSNYSNCQDEPGYVYHHIGGMQ